MKSKEFAVFIISNNRPNDVITFHTLRTSGYTGEIFIIIDDKDEKKDLYINKYKDIVIVFDKEKIAQYVDHGDNFWNLRTTTHARNACFDIAEKIGIKYFLVLDDDYVKFDFRLNGSLNYPSGKFKIRNLDAVFNSYLNFYKNTYLLSVCMSQGGDYIGGSNGSFAENKMSRKAMNSFFCSINRKFNFISRLNEDVNTYLTLGSKGGLFATVPFCSITQKQTQATSGGMTDSYLLGGTFVKSFYTVMYCPSFAKVKLMSNRLHHSINWDNAVPYIIDEKHKK
jgi:hypothetical protein